MHLFSHQNHHSKSSETVVKETKGLILNQGWRYDLIEWFSNNFAHGGKLRDIRRRTINLACIQSGEQVLDVGCGTGTLAMEAQQYVGTTGRVFGIDPGTKQIARARSKATRRKLPIDFQIGVIEQLNFPDETFDVVLSTIMMHHLPNNIKRQGLSEIIRVLKPGGRLVVADFKSPKKREDQSKRFGSVRDLTALVMNAGLTQMEIEEMVFPPAGVSFVKAFKSEYE